jgi:hypothetical protein
MSDIGDVEPEAVDAARVLVTLLVEFSNHHLKSPFDYEAAEMVASMAIG